jgi:hypothetical protein
VCQDTSLAACVSRHRLVPRGLEQLVYQVHSSMFCNGEPRGESPGDVAFPNKTGLFLTAIFSISIGSSIFSMSRMSTAF